jgi:hypothetical protein
MTLAAPRNETYSTADHDSIDLPAKQHGIGRQNPRMRELLRPWKLVTLAIGLGLLVVGSFVYDAPDWDIPVSILMALVAYLTAPWCMRVMVERRWRQWPAMLLLTWFGVDGCYAAYWSIVNPEALALMREANAPASLALFLAVGLVWMPKLSLHELAQQGAALVRGGLSNAGGGRP